MKQKLERQLDLTAKKLKQNKEAEIVNDTKISVANQMHNGDDWGYGSDLDAVHLDNGQLDAKIENEHQLIIHIEKVQECDLLKQQIYECKFNRDQNGDKWLEFNKHAFPLLENNTRLDNITNSTKIARISNKYIEKNNTGENPYAVAADGRDYNNDDRFAFTLDPPNNNSDENNNFYIEEVGSGCITKPTFENPFIRFRFNVNGKFYQRENQNLGFLNLTIYSFSFIFDD